MKYPRIAKYFRRHDAPEKIIERAGLEVDSPLRPVSNYLNNIRKTNRKFFR